MSGVPSAEVRLSEVVFAFQPGGPYPSHCGYCHGDVDGLYLEGVWSNGMKARDFQDLVDRGCQRSGKFVYLPSNRLTCCPQYVLRVDTRTFKISKQQRRVVRRFNSYLLDGKEEQRPQEDAPTLPSQDDPTLPPQDDPTLPLQPTQVVETVSEGRVTEKMSDSKESAATLQEAKKRKKVAPGKGPDPDRPPCRKAKDIRQAKKQQKLEAKGKMSMVAERVSKATLSQDATSNMVEEVRLPNMLQCKHRFRTELVCINPVGKEFWNSYNQSYDVFRKFQMVIHKEPPEKCSKSQFNDFIMGTPLVAEESEPGTGINYGSYHLQYWIDDTLLMVGVLDIIPKGVLCNYLYYDPDMRFLAPGVYSALHEIAMTQELCQRNPHLQYYYMGYYVHDCPKMNYKRHYNSAYLLCQETYDYVPLAVCRRKLDDTRVCRFSDSTKPCEETFVDEDMDNVPINYQRRRCLYRELKARAGTQYDVQVSKYLAMVGRDLAKRMCLRLLPYRSLD